MSDEPMEETDVLDTASNAPLEALTNAPDDVVLTFYNGPVAHLERTHDSVEHIIAYCKGRLLAQRVPSNYTGTIKLTGIPHLAPLLVKGRTDVTANVNGKLITLVKQGSTFSGPELLDLMRIVGEHQRKHLVPK